MNEKAVFMLVDAHPDRAAAARAHGRRYYLVKLREAQLGKDAEQGTLQSDPAATKG